MSTTLDIRLHKLTRHHQNRLWLKRICERTSLLIWWPVFVLFLGGSIHQFMLPLDPRVVAGIAILPVVIALSWIAASVKPTPEEGAAVADSLFDANSLFVSAWELSRTKTTHEGVDRLLMARTESLLPDWQKRNKSKQQPYIRPAGLIVATLSLVGLLFLSLPTHVKTGLSPSTEPTLQGGLITRPGDTAQELSELFNADNNKTAQVTDQNIKSGYRAESPGAVQPLSLPVRDQTASPVTSEELSQTEGASSGQQPPPLAQKVPLPTLSTDDGITVPEHSPGNDTATDAAPYVSTIDDFEQISFVDIETGTDARSTAFDSSREGSELIAYRPEQSVLPRAAAHTQRKRSHTVSATLLTAQQRNHVRRYFNQLDKIDDQNQ